ncbi:MAG: ribonuclease III [Bacteroidetes bacterium]|nr:ribonuclease III [Bacteroidota bacterium]MCW5896630.1 ribonuclease III [Bacteroidota bacterium]
MGWLKELREKFFPSASGGLNKDSSGGDESIILPPVNIKGLEQALQHKIRNAGYFVQALVHRSYLQQTNQHGESNERLEFLGDSILNLIVGEYLYRHFPSADEGELTKVRSRLVNRKALVAFSKSINLSSFILMSHSAQQSMGKGSDTIVADTYEAIIAAVYLDGGFDAAKKFVERQLVEALENRTVITSDENYKSMLLEFAQAHGLGVPRYTIVREEGPDHDRTFTVEVSLNGKKSGTGTGKNKKEAEQLAASRALEKLQKK